MPIPPRFYTIALFCLALGMVYLSQGLWPDDPVDREWMAPQPTALLTAKTVPDTAPYVWWEAEQPTATNFPEQHPFAPQTPEEAAVLSGGRWIGVEGDRPHPLFLEYEITVPDTDDYFFYSRKFWHHGPFRWHWDDQPWQDMDHGLFLMDDVKLRRFVVANWVPLGPVRLTAGAHTLRLELTENQGAAAFDCFVLSQEPMQARGKLKPDQRYAADIPGWFVFDPEVDAVEHSPIDLRSLNEPIAGSQGWIQVQGETLVHQTTGVEERFWGVNVGADVLAMDNATLAQMAHFFAKKGVNLVRFHSSLTPSDRLVLDPARRDRLFALVAALKQEGIYTALSIYFPLWFQFSASQGQSPFGLLFFDRPLQAQYRTLWQDLLTVPNPQTGLTLAADPAVALVELVNEDSLFFWTFDPETLYAAPQREDLERQFATWLGTHYESLDQVLESWGPTANAARRGTDRVAVWGAGAIAAQPNSRQAQDTAAFLTNLQYQFFDQSIHYLKTELGYGGLVVASNWITADAQRLGPLDKFTNTVGDVMDRHGYFSAPHEGPEASYALNPGDRYQDRSALLLQNPRRDGSRPLSLPIMDLRYNQKPSIISEVNWAMPNRLRADFPILAAAYGLLQGTDGVVFFAAGNPAWESQLGKFAIASPVVMGQFPAAARIYRQGLLQPGHDMVTIERKLTDLLALEGAPIVAPQNLDALRAADVPTQNTPTPSPDEQIDPLAFFVGNVTLQISADRHQTETADLAPYHNPSRSTLQSSTHEMTWDYDEGLLLIHSPQVKGMAGFLRHGSARQLAPLRFSTTMEYGALLLVALDGQPLEQSQNMLLQVMSADENFGWRTEGEIEKTLLATGTPPLVVQHLSGMVSLRSANARSMVVKALDIHGNVVEDIGSARRWRLRPDIFYYQITRQS